MVIYLFAEELFVLQSLVRVVLHHPPRGLLRFVIVVTTSAALGATAWEAAAKRHARYLVERVCR